MGWQKRAKSVGAWETLVWERVAYACRYGSIGLEEALRCDTLWLVRFNDALATIVKQENAKGSRD